MSAATEFCPLELRLAPEYHRCVGYVVAGYVVVAGVVIGYQIAGINNNPWAGVISVLAVLGAATGLLVALVVRYRIRIDEHGVWRRRFARWDLWPWEAFEDGRVHFGRLPDQLTFPEKPWYWRTISASLLGERNRALYETVVDRYHVPPPPPEVPDELILNLPMRGTLELSATGVRWTPARADAKESVAWSDVKAEALQVTHRRPGFFLLNLHLPGRAKPVRLGSRSGERNWTGADSEVICLFLREHLGDDWFVVTALRGPPADLAEADRRLARLDAAERDLRKTRRVVGYLHLGLWLFLSALILEPWNPPVPWNWGWAEWLRAAIVVGGFGVALGLHDVMFAGVAHFRGRELRRDRAEVLRWRAGHAAMSTT